MKPERKITKTVKIGNRAIGGGLPVLIQSMTNTPTADVNATLAQIKSLEEAGCDIVRFTVNDMDCIKSIAKFKESTNIPLVADIHFDYRLALEACAAGVDKIRINPGNIGGEDKVKAVALACRNKGIPIRVGVNSGSVEKHLLEKYGGPCPEALCESAVDKVRMLEKYDFCDIVVSVKSSDTVTMIKTNRLLSQRLDYPIHLGVTEAGTLNSGIIKSSAGIGSLLCAGIGDTIRVSLTTSDLTQEVKTAKRLLSACGLTDSGIDIISCPTCGRTKIDLVSIVNELENRIEKLKLQGGKAIKVAVMGCAVNGPGEAREADVGIAGGSGEAILFKKGEIIEKLPEEKILDRLTEEIEYILRTC